MDSRSIRSPNGLSKLLLDMPVTRFIFFGSFSAAWTPAPRIASIFGKLGVLLFCIFLRSASKFCHFFPIFSTFFSIFFYKSPDAGHLWGSSRGRFWAVFWTKIARSARVAQRLATRVAEPLGNFFVRVWCGQKQSQPTTGTHGFNIFFKKKNPKKYNTESLN